FYQAEDGIPDRTVTEVQTCALPISLSLWPRPVARQLSQNAGAESPSISYSNGQYLSSSARLRTSRCRAAGPLLDKDDPSVSFLRSEERREGKENWMYYVCVLI